VAGGTSTFLEVHEFFTAYAQNPDSPLSFFVADKRLLLGLMVLFQHQPTLSLRTDRVDMVDILEALAERKIDQILSLRAGNAWGISLATKGRPAANFLVPRADESEAASEPAEQLVLYARRHADGVAVDVYETTRVEPAGDVILVTPETRGRLVEVFLRVAAKVREEAAAAPLELETPSPEPVAIEADDRPLFPPVDELRIEEPPAARVEVEVKAPPLELEGPAEPAPTPAAAPTAEEPAAASITPAAGPVPELLFFVGDKQLGTFSLAAGEATIGRTPNNTIIIDNAGVSRRHAVIRLKGKKAIVEDLGSSNGTFIRGQKIQEYELQDGDEIVIVKHRLVYRIPKDADASSKADAMADVGQKTMYIDSAAVAQAVGSRPGTRPEAVASTLRPRLILPDLKKFALDTDEVNLGTAIGCQVQLSGMFVGKVHAKIVRTKEGQFKLHHLSGLAATRVNGEKITEHLLKHGDEIEIGKQKLLFRLER
jgi:pSer/pThr/pTyr-binding forkhead associated (FHA) protein